MELILVRHGLPQRIERDSGAADPELSDTGHEQAQAVGAWLAANESIDAVYASPMRRAHQTAEPYAKASNHEITLIEEVAEFDRKSRSYVPMEQLKKENYKAWLRMADGNYGSKVDLSSFRDTVVAGIEGVIANHRGERALIFCHGGVINMWATHCLGAEPRMFADVRYCSISRFMCASTGQRNIYSLNETQHLRG